MKVADTIDKRLFNLMNTIYRDQTVECIYRAPGAYRNRVFSYRNQRFVTNTFWGQEVKGQGHN